MKRASRSEPALMAARRHVVGDHIAGSIPNYLGCIPGSRVEADISFGTHSRNIDACRHARSRATYDTRTHDRIQREEKDRLARSVPRGFAPMHDARGISHPFAGDVQHSRVPIEGEERIHFHSDLGLTSHTHENRGGFGNLRGYGSSTRGIPGFTGHIPGKFAENIFADGWSKMTEKSVASHIRARRKGPKEMTMIAEGGTIVAPTSSDMLPEIPIHSSSYQCRHRGWSDCRFTGVDIDPAGRQAPKDRQDAYGSAAAPPSNKCIHGYMGWVPGRVGESVVGERQCKTNDISEHLFRKNRMRVTQR